MNCLIFFESDQNWARFYEEPQGQQKLQWLRTLADCLGLWAQYFKQQLDNLPPYIMIDRLIWQAFHSGLICPCLFATYFEILCQSFVFLLAYDQTSCHQRWLGTLAVILDLGYSEVTNKRVYPQKYYAQYLSGYTHLLGTSEQTIEFQAVATFTVPNSPWYKTLKILNLELEY